MCMSPHEMTSAHIEGIIERLKKYDHSSWLIGEYEAILKERAEDGTYHTAGQIDNYTHRNVRNSW